MRHCGCSSVDRLEHPRITVLRDVLLYFFEHEAFPLVWCPGGTLRSGGGVALGAEPARLPHLRGTTAGRYRPGFLTLEV